MIAGKAGAAVGGKGWFAGGRHTFIESSHDYLRFVVQAPFTPGDKVSEPSPLPDRIRG
jgi:hypothetical protein